jgi:hypothetical protein
MYLLRSLVRSRHIAVAGALVLSLGAAGAACKRGDKAPANDTSCEAVGRHVVDYATRQIDELEGRSKKHARATLLGMLPQLKKRIVGECTSGKWPESLRRCYLRARSDAEANQCKKTVPSQDVAAPANPG